MESRIKVLGQANFLSTFATWLLMTYLTEVWKLSITHAAGIVNIWQGITLILPIAFTYLMDTVLGSTRMLALSSIFYSIGLGFLAMSTPPVLSKSTGTCSKYEPECIGRTQKVLFYVALSFIAVGRSGSMVSLRQVLNQNRRSFPSRKKKLRGVASVYYLTMVGGIALPYITPWSIRFGIPTMCTVVATIIFLCGWHTYVNDVLEGSSLTGKFRGIVASAFKIVKRCTTVIVKSASKSVQCCSSSQKNDHIPSEIRSPRDKPDAKTQNQKRNSIPKILNEMRNSIHMIPMWLVFLIWGFIFSAGDTYFQEQANSLSPYAGKLKVSLTTVLVVQYVGEAVCFKITQRLKRFLEILDLERYELSVYTLVSMILATLCCITAARVESRRLDVIRSHDLIEKPEDTIPMTILWVLPQYVLLGGLNCITDKITINFMIDKLPTCMIRYFRDFTSAVYGLGYMASMLLVYVVGKISESGGNQNWFQYTSNKSRLDNYFWVLSALSAINFLLYILVTWLHRDRKVTEGKKAEDQHDEEQHNEDQHNDEFNKLFGEYFKENSKIQ